MGKSEWVSDVTGSWSSRIVGRAVIVPLVCVLVGFGQLLGAGSASAASVLSPSPTSLDFGGVDMHFQQTMQVSFFNNSGSSVTVGPAGVTILGVDASSFSLQKGQDLCTGHTIAAGEGCHVNVEFGPLSDRHQHGERQEAQGEGESAEVHR